MTRPRGEAPVRVANCSGFFGDRLAAAREMLEGGPIDYLTGDYLAELTMLILWKARAKDPTLGFASTFLRQMEDVLGLAIERGVRIVVNAGVNSWASSMSSKPAKAMSSGTRNPRRPASSMPPTARTSFAQKMASTSGTEEITSTNALAPSARLVSDRKTELAVNSTPACRMPSMNPFSRARVRSWRCFALTRATLRYPQATRYSAMARAAYSFE